MNALDTNSDGEAGRKRTGRSPLAARPRRPAHFGYVPRRGSDAASGRACHAGRRWSAVGRCCRRGTGPVRRIGGAATFCWAPPPRFRLHCTRTGRGAAERRACSRPARATRLTAPTSPSPAAYLPLEK